MGWGQGYGLESNNPQRGLRHRRHLAGAGRKHTFAERLRNRMYNRPMRGWSSVGAPGAAAGQTHGGTAMRTLFSASGWAEDMYAPGAGISAKLGINWGARVSRAKHIVMPTANRYGNRPNTPGQRASIGIHVGLGALAGLGIGGGPGMLVGGTLGSFLAHTPTGFQTGAFGLLGGAIGATAGPYGAVLGAAAGAAIGGVGPIHGIGGIPKLWRSGIAGKVGLGAAGAAGVGVLGAAAFGGGFGADAVLQGEASAATGLALAAPAMAVGAMTLPGRGRTFGLAAVGAGLGAFGGPVGGMLGGVAGMGLGMGMGVRSMAKDMAMWGTGLGPRTEASQMAGARLAGLGARGWGATGKIGTSLVHAVAKHPGKMGGLLGMSLGISGLLGGLANAAMSPEPVGSMAMGSREALYGMDPNNLDTQALTLALHYKHQ